MELVALWTAGTIESDEMRRLYAALLRERSLSRSSPLHLHPSGEEADVDHQSIAIPDDESDERFLQPAQMVTLTGHRADPSPACPAGAASSGNAENKIEYQFRIPWGRRP
ncbi:hypothetical protein [Rhizobium grahamii]|uniref:Uncharacterized protein n=1 Tax=Rhizobium grahamii CCGE 502 TaxID=990285 RepID=S3H6L4_9HYPH|nr:hypothetical protein [Rhizobium grahamii]EPE93900.1 hypothetical protein RGCCGE502_33971 [Rhizobium grahamii CCGE 502]